MEERENRRAKKGVEPLNSIGYECVYPIYPNISQSIKFRNVRPASSTYPHCSENVFRTRTRLGVFIASLS